MPWQSEPDDQDFEPVDGQVVGQTKSAYRVITSSLEEFWVPKSVSQLDGSDGLVVRRWFIEKEGLLQ